MTGPFDTVADIEEWLEDEEPGPETVREALEVERDGPDRTTGKEALRTYLESVEEASGGDDGTVEFRVQYPFDNHEVGETVELDPDDERTERLRSSGRVELS